jgi:hypothetical protein
MKTLTLRLALVLIMLGVLAGEGVCQVAALVTPALPESQLPFEISAAYGDNHILIVSSGGDGVLNSDASVRIVRGTKAYFRSLTRSAPCIVFYGYVRKPVATQINGRYSIMESVNDRWLEWETQGDHEQAIKPHYLMIFEAAYPGPMPSSPDSGRKIASKDIEKYLSYALEFTIDLPSGGISRPIIATYVPASVQAHPGTVATDICYTVGARLGTQDLLAHLRPVSEDDIAYNCPTARNRGDKHALEGSSLIEVQGSTAIQEQSSSE